MILHSPQGPQAQPCPPGPQQGGTQGGQERGRFWSRRRPRGLRGVSWGSWDCPFPGKKLAKEVQGSGAQAFWAVASSECPCEL